MSEESSQRVCQWTSWAEVADCDNEATQTLTFHGEEIHVCDHHANVLEGRQ